MSGITATAETKPVTSLPAAGSGIGGSAGSSGSSGSSGAVKTAGSASSGKSVSVSKANAGGASASGSGGTGFAERFYAAVGPAADRAAGSSDRDLLDVTAQGTVTKGSAAKDSAGIPEAAAAAVPRAEVRDAARIDPEGMKRQLKELAGQQLRQAVAGIDNAVAGEKESLQRDLEEALPRLQTQRDQIAADEARALDNQVLYAAARGDRGGLGQAQYGAIRNTAARSRQSVNAAQSALYTDTARRVAELERQGEFEKADRVLAVSQEYTGKLMELEKWAREKNVGVDEFNAKLAQWKAEFDRDTAEDLTDAQLAAAKLSESLAGRYAAGGKAMIAAGIVPSREQLAAMGWTPEAGR